jgi:hypothetical protein
MATNLAEALRLNGSPADEIVVEAACTFSGPLAKPRLLALALAVYGRVPGIDAAGFRQVAAEARRRSLRACGSREDLRGDLSAELEPSPSSGPCVDHPTQQPLDAASRQGSWSEPAPRLIVRRHCASGSVAARSDASAALILTGAASEI